MGHLNDVHFTKVLQVMKTYAVLFLKFNCGFQQASNDWIISLRNEVNMNNLYQTPYAWGITSYYTTSVLYCRVNKLLLWHANFYKCNTNGLSRNFQESDLNILQRFSCRSFVVHLMQLRVSTIFTKSLSLQLKCTGPSTFRLELFILSPTSFLPVMS